MTDPDLVKMSEVAQRCGIPLDIVKMLAADGLLSQAVRGRGGYFYLPADQIPTWSECVKLLEEQRDRHLRNMSSALRRLDTELEAVRNDLNEAREYPRETLGVDMMSFGHWTGDRVASQMLGQPTVTSILEKFTSERLRLHRYHDAYLDALGSHGHSTPGDLL